MNDDATILCGDALDLMRAMPTGSVDLVFCSPPYEAARTYGIDFKLRGQAWVDWAKERFLEAHRVSRGLTAWVVEGQTRQFAYSATPMLLMADLHRAGVGLRKPPIYQRDGIPGSGGPEWLKNRYEPIVCASHGKLPWANNVAMGHPPKFASGGSPSHRAANGERVNKLRDGGMRRANGVRRKCGYAIPALANPGNIIACGAAGGGHMGSPIAHENEAPFPEALADFFIRSFCPPGGIVLDCFGGSGTTMAAALKAGRKCVSIDIRESQCELMKRRLDEVRGRLEAA